MACKTQLITISLVTIVALFSLQRQSVTSERTRGTKATLLSSLSLVPLNLSYLAQLAVLTSSELLQTTPATFFSSLSLAPVNRSDVVQLAVANATVNLCGQLQRRS